MKLIWSPKAGADRDAQLACIVQDNAAAAINHGDRIAEQMAILIQNPEMGRAGRKKGTRELAISRTPFVVVYRVKGDTIQIVRLLQPVTTPALSRGVTANS
ncbi:plasmid stabilization system protein [mine drainage metagenome]|uniref:Plasmid stabilization system protein n=1 Tax=mine drainage metagenome TaxID=410659 RepID=A0A1J5Q6F9_9ZZZZ